MSTEERITARDSAAPSSTDVVREGWEHLAKMTGGEWLVLADGRHAGNLRIRSSYTLHVAKVYANDLTDSGDKATRNAHGIAWMRNNLATLLNRLTTAEASASANLARAELAERDNRTLRALLDEADRRESFFREALKRIESDYGLNHTSKWARDFTTAILADPLARAALTEATPEDSHDGR